MVLLRMGGEEVVGCKACAQKRRKMGGKAQGAKTSIHQQAFEQARAESTVQGLGCATSRQKK